MPTKKKYRLDITATLKSLKPGQQVSFCVAGNGMEVSLDTLRSIKSRGQLPIEIALYDNATKAKVTRTA